MQIELNKTRVDITFPFAAVVTLMLLICDEETVLMSLFSSLFHEAGHLFFMLLFGDAPSLICFGAFGIRFEKDALSCLSRKKEAAVALGGIAGNCLLFICGLVFYFIYNSMWAAKLMAVNLFIAAFNMMPVRLLDFGRCLECLFSDKPSFERILSLLSLFTAVTVGIGCILYNVFVCINVSMIAVSVYVILITTLKE